MNFEETSADCKKMIIPYLTYKKDLINLRLTSKSLNTIIEDTDMGRLLRKANNLEPADWEQLCMKIARPIPNLNSIHSEAITGIFCGAIFNIIGGNLFSIMGTSPSTGILIATSLLAMKCAYETFVPNRKVSNTDHVGMLNVLAVSLMFCWNPDASSSILPFMRNISQIMAINLVGTCAIKACNQFTLFYNKKQSIISGTRKQLELLESPNQGKSNNQMDMP